MEADKKINIVSFSGGKDSTAMLLMMLEKDIQVDEIIFCDTGKEFPQMYKHLERIEKYIDRKITRLKPKHSFEDMLKKIGGWPSFYIRWCTGEFKRDQTKRYMKGKSYILNTGIAFDEQKRIKNNKKNGVNYKYPLVEWGVTEKDALEYCYSKGFDWDGLYEDLKRVSCYCCPLQRIGELRTIYLKYPELWEDMRNMDKLSHYKFRPDYTLQELEDRFAKEKIKTEKEELC